MKTQVKPLLHKGNTNSLNDTSHEGGIVKRFFTKGIYILLLCTHLHADNKLIVHV